MKNLQKFALIKYSFTIILLVHFQFNITVYHNTEQMVILE